MAKLTILHTSDWHIGQQLYNQQRDDEFQAFFKWLCETIQNEKVDVLVVAGDIFDSSTPPHKAHELYYDVLEQAANAGVRHIVITAGNHDSPSFLSAPGSLLRKLRIHVVSSITDNIDDEIIELKDEHGETELIVCAVPFLRERELRFSIAGESEEDKERKFSEGVRNHYQLIATHAEERRQALGSHIPIVATGHLYASGATTGDDIRRLYIGTLGRIPVDIFPDTFDYVALGHIHRPQKVGANPSRRYCGSPLPMSFEECTHPRQICLVRFEGRTAEIQSIQVPFFQKMITIRGSRKDILEKLEQIKSDNTGINKNNTKIWLEILHEGPDSADDLYAVAHRMVKNTCLEILTLQIIHSPHSLPKITHGQDLRSLSPHDVFGYRLKTVLNKSEERKKNMRLAFEELLDEYYANTDPKRKS